MNWLVWGLTTWWKQDKRKTSESSLTLCLSFKETQLSKPIAGALYGPDKIKQSGFAGFTCIIFKT